MQTMHLKDLHGETLGICVSGGLDSRTVTVRSVLQGVVVKKKAAWILIVRR